jgi:hypothetical protein
MVAPTLLICIQRGVRVFRRLVLLVALMVLGFSAPAVSQQQPASIVRFTRDAAQLKAKQDQILAAMRPHAPAVAEELRKLFSQDLIAVIAPALQRIGFDHQDMADMTALYWVTAWEASHGIVGRETDPKLAQGARGQIARVYSANPATARMSDRVRQDVADTMLLQAILAEMRMNAAAKLGPAMQKQMSDTIHAEASRILKTDLRKVTLTTAGFAPVTAGVAGADGAGGGTAPQNSTASAPAGAVSPAAHPENWEQVEGVYFRSYTTFGVGGMVISDFEPLVFFRDGSYFEVEGPAIEDTDLGASRRAKPNKWGRWAKNGDAFTLTSAKGKSSQHKLQDGSFFKAFPAEASSNKLAAKYTRVSGGGNSALGGEMTIAAQTDLSFTADGRYMRASAAGAIGSGNTTGVATSVYSQSARGIGRYRIERYTITLTEPDGKIRRQFFAFASKKSPPQPATDMLFLGDRVYISRGD